MVTLAWSAKVGGWGGCTPTPLEFAEDKLGGVEPPSMILREFKKMITYVIMYWLFLLGEVGSNYIVNVFSSTKKF